MVNEAELREQFREAFDGAAYPVTSPMDLLPVLPEGPNTTFASGDFEMTATDLNNELANHVDFPFQDVDAFVEAVMAALEEEGYV